MALEQLVAKGSAELSEKDYLSALGTFNRALEENPDAFQPYLKRAKAYKGLGNYEFAKKDISMAFSVAQKRGRREDIGFCFFNLGLIYYVEKKIGLALRNIDKAKAFGCTEGTLDTWKRKCEYDISKNPSLADIGKDSDDELDVKTAQVSISQNDSHVQETHPKPKIKDDWYQNNEYIFITIYAKNIDPTKLNVDYSENAISVSFSTGTNIDYNYNLEPLYATIDPQNSLHNVYSTKMELTLRKKQTGKWSSLERLDDFGTSTPRESNSEATKLSYPTSSRKPIDWSSINLEDEENGKEKSENDFFAQIYSNTDDDTRRAMMKSYVQSNGTVLTTNWEEASNKTFETSPPEGMIEKKWDPKK